MDFKLTVDGETKYLGNSVANSLVEYMHYVRESRVNGQAIILLRDGVIHKEFVCGRKIANA